MTLPTQESVQFVNLFHTCSAAVQKGVLQQAHLVPSG